MGLINRITETVADALVTRSPAYRAAETKLKEASDLLSIYSILDPRYWSAVGSSRRDMPADVRDTISRQAWTIYQTNPTAAGFVNNVSAFVIGPGFQVKHPDPAADAELQEYIAVDRFMTLATEALNQYLITAEDPTLIYLDTLTGNAAVRVFDPLELFDVAYDADDGRTVVALWRRYVRREAILAAKSWTWKDENIDDIIEHDEKRPEEWGAYTIRDFVFWKRPTMPNVQRGVSFMTPSLKWMTNYEKLLEARLALNRARATYARDLQVDGATKEECIARQEELNALGEPRPGAWFVRNEKTKLSFPAPSIGAGDAKDDLRAFILMVVAGLSVPEFIATGDASNANFASTTNVVQAFVKGIQKLQTDLTDGWVVPVCGRILRAKAEARRISPEAAATPVEVTCPQILPEALDQLTNLIIAGLTNGFLDEETVVDLLPFDIKWDTIRERREARRNERIKQAGGLPNVHPPAAVAGETL